MIAKGNVRVILKKVARVQGLVGKAYGAALDDRNSQRMDILAPALREAMDLCIEITGMYERIKGDSK